VDTFIERFDFLSMPALSAVFIAVGLAFTFGLEYLAHHRIQPETRERVSTSTAVMIQVLAVFYSVLVAFVIVGERSATSDAAAHVTGEAAAMTALFHNVQGFPPAIREPIRDAIFAYDRSVLREDFDAVDRLGGPSPRTTARLGELYASLQGAEPEVGGSAFYQQATSDLSDITKSRRDRNAAATDSIPGPLFFLVVVISVLVIAVATLLNTRERGTHVALLTVLAVVISLNLALIVALEHPFGGAIAVSDEPLRVGVLEPAAR
jgi:drug/metabolite transporter (DMT)-like permease